ncbi:MAG: hypothetical protein EON50_00480 [Acidovorax sp.]|nr:MAG: hypothetical protein EON50_00480 [Acidovorax sp.]
MRLDGLQKSTSESGILRASLKAMALNVFFPGASRDTSAAEHAPRQADANQCPACPVQKNPSSATRGAPF